MKNHKSLLIILLFLSAGFSCKFRSDVSDVNGHCLNLDIRRVLNQKEKDHVLTDLTAGIKYIPLEKNDSCLMYGVQKLDIVKEHIFVTDRMGLYQFDMYGRFIRLNSQLEEDYISDKGKIK